MIRDAAIPLLWLPFPEGKKAAPCRTGQGERTTLKESTRLWPCHPHDLQKKGTAEIGINRRSAEERRGAKRRKRVPRKGNGRDDGRCVLRRFRRQIGDNRRGRKNRIGIARQAEEAGEGGLMAGIVRRKLGDARSRPFCGGRTGVNSRVLADMGYLVNGACSGQQKVAESNKRRCYGMYDRTFSEHGGIAVRDLFLSDECVRSFSTGNLSGQYNDRPRKNV